MTVDHDRTAAEAAFGVEIAWWEFLETLRATPEGRRCLAILEWLARHPRVARLAARLESFLSRR